MNGKSLETFRRAHMVRAMSLRYLRPALAVLVAGSFVLTGLMPRVKAAAGDVDTSFGNGGEVITDFPGTSYSQPSGLAVQADGKIVAAGFSQGISKFHEDFQVFSLARYHQDGTLDATFGTGGRVETNFPPFTFSACFAVALQPDGKIVAGGVASTFSNLGSTSLFALARYNIDGSLDASFGSGGRFTFDLGVFFQEILALAVQPDGRIVAAGAAALSGITRLVVLRLNSDGTLDPSFGFGGITGAHFGAAAIFGAHVALQSDGRILATCNVSVIHNEFGVVRFNPDGSPDMSFGTAGEVLTDFDFAPLGAAPHSVRPLPDGRILVGGAPVSGVGCAIARYEANGALDPSFGVGGRAVSNFPGGVLVLLPDGKFIMAGLSFGPFPLTRFNSDGTVDTTFGNNGNVQTSFGGFITAATIYGSDQILIAGVGVLPDPADFELVRFLGDPAPRSADLEVTTQAFLSSDDQGNRFITYRINVADLGPDPAHYVTLFDHLPLQTTFQSIEVPDGWVVYRKPGQSQRGFGLQQVISVSCALVDLRKAPASITIVARLRSPGPHTLTNNASVDSSFDPDPNVLNNTVTTTTSVP